MNSYFETGVQALHAGDTQKAESQFNQAIEHDSLNFEAYFFRGKTRWQNGNLSGAINDFQKVLDINPSHNQSKVSMEMVKQILAFRNPDLYNP